jgi:branched-subunit amino acid aminotransferase/4-amino-4-deoxychorismate lyase
VAKSPARPDPRLGVFETMLVLAGRPVELEAHLARLAASIGTLFGAGLPPRAAALVEERARDLRLGRLRLELVPGEAGLRCQVQAEEIDAGVPFPDEDRGVALHSIRIEGGLGAHKWVDRSLLPTAEAVSAPLLVEPDGEVLEAGWANVFAAQAGSLLTPAADGRILPGIARRGLIDEARAAGLEVTERALAAEELLMADEVFLTGSLRGVEVAHSLDGAPLGNDRAVSRQVAELLRRRWGT